MTRGTGENFLLYIIEGSDRESSGSRNQDFCQPQAFFYEGSPPAPAAPECGPVIDQTDSKPVKKGGVSPPERQPVFIPPAPGIIG
jgi:hypothetical protein